MANQHPVTKGRSGKNKPETHLIKVYTVKWLASLGQEGFNAWADENRTEAMKIAAKFVPTQIETPPGSGIEIKGLPEVLAKYYGAARE